ncbi:MAG: hypothetical protein IJK52_12905 [Oscillospiraceae bacterium]|nr:hypothetical protein [Oscillospiraceae bacterium]
MKYLITFRPLEPYTFGTDRTFDYPSEEKTGKESYFVLSGTVPAQTTVLGALRYLVLKRKGLLRTDFHYPDLAEVRAAVGPESFRFDAGTPQSFGAIHSVSPLFLWRGGHILIRNPFHNRAESEDYRPMRLSAKAVWTSCGEIRLPDAGEYDAKRGYADGYIEIESKAIYRDLFQSVTLPGNRKTTDADQRAYYRRQMMTLQSDCRFAVYVAADADALPPDSVVYMGQKRAAFRVTAEPLTEEISGTVTDKKAFGTAAEILETQVRKAFADGSELWLYALSPLRVPADTVFDAFCMVEETSQRNLTTNYAAEQAVHKLKRSAVRYNLIQAGSVFYGERPAIPADENCRNIGYNSVVQLGGKLS